MTRTTHRRGAILLIVLVLLALFAVVGLSFVIYAQAEATQSRITRETMNAQAGDVKPDPTPSINDFIRQLIYVSADNNQSITSAMRGHELSRNSHGYNPNGSNITPYNGIGGFSQTIAPAAGITDRRQVVSYFGINNGDTVLDPEHTGTRTVSQVVGNTGLGTYVGKNAPYSYPDRNNMAMAMQDPETGLIVVPSFFRPEVFNLNWAAVSDKSSVAKRIENQLRSLDPNNPNWTNDAGRFLLLRPRPWDHKFDSGDGRGLVSDFPYVPSNTERINGNATYTGDVQNIVYTNGVQRNDAIWMHANLPQVDYRGRKVQPLVAATVVPLDGRVNGNVAGNHRDSGNGHASHQGFGPYEINPQKVLVSPATTNPSTPVNEGKDLVNWRYGGVFRPPYASQASGNNSAYIDQTIQGTAFAPWSPVNFDAFNAPFPQPLPANHRTEPYYSSTAGYDNNLTSPNHQSLYNPYFCTDIRTATSGGRTLRLFDLRQTAYRFSDKKSAYAPPLYGFTSQDSSFTGVGPNHPSNTARALLTTISNSMVTPGISPNFAAMGALTTAPTDPLRAPGTQVSAAAFNPTGATADSIAGNGFHGAAAAMGVVDLNRPLADYRLDKNTSLSVSNIANQAAADADRQLFARDIFERLVLATGAPCDATLSNGRPTFATVTSPAQLQVLKQVAQIAVNIVDYVDTDDISTGFQYIPSQPQVWGVEKTRLVLNEVYAEVANAVEDSNRGSATNPFEVRFFIEVMNPLNANQVHTGPVVTSAPTGDKKTRLNAGGNSIYRVQVYDSQATVHNNLFGPGAATNTGSPGVTPKITANIPYVPGPQPTDPPYSDVEPNDGVASTTGFRMLCSNRAINQDSGDSSAYRPTTSPQVIPISGGTGVGLYYEVNTPSTPVQPPQIPGIITQVNTAAGRQHAVLLQRLANPHMPPGPSNPYITVDSMFDIRVLDAVRVGQRTNPLLPNSGTRSPAPSAATNGTGQNSHARKAPLYAYRGTDQTSSYAIDQARSMNSRNMGTFQTIEWLVHHDRKLITPMEVLQVAACKPHEVLHYFCTSATAQADATLQPTHKQNHTVRWTTTNSGMQRGLEMLSIKPWMYGIPVGGRMPGKININTAWNKKIFEAIFDPRNDTTIPSNGNIFTPTEVDYVWNNLATGSNTASRTKAFPYVSTTVEEGDANGDRPIKSFGVSNFGVSGTTPDESWFRNDTTGNMPAIFANKNSSSSPTAYNHPMQQQEMLRKTYNNFTTVSDTYMVVFTIGYFEIRQQPTGTRLMPILGREVYQEVPGDLRVKYGAVIDRTMLSRDPVNTTNQGANTFYTEICSPTGSTNVYTFDATANSTGAVTLAFRATGGTATSLEVQYEGNVVKIVRQGATLKADEVNTLVIGSGADMVVVPIPASATFTAPGTTGVASITFQQNTFVPQFPLQPSSTAPLRKYYNGECVGSVIPGNPGPQPSFDPNAAAYKSIVRDLFELK